MAAATGSTAASAVGSSAPASTSPAAVRAAFFASWPPLAQSGKIEVRDVPGKGVGVYVRAAVAEGEVLFGEDPEAAVQWRRAPLACEHCLQALGTLDFQMSFLADHRKTPDSDPSALAKLPGLSEAERAPPPGLRRGWSPWRGKPAWFCSEACQTAASEECAVLKGQEDAVRAFVEHAAASGVPFFVVALKALLRRSGRDLLEQLLQRPYWECVDLPDENADAFLDEIKADLAASWGLLRKLEFPGRPASQAAYSRLVGSLCLNAVAVKYAHPLILYCQEVDQGCARARAELRPTLEQLQRHRSQVAAAGGADAGSASCEEDSESDLEDDELTFSWGASGESKAKPFEFSTRLFPPMKGYGLYTGLSACNHSCDPSAEVFFAGSSKLLLVARRTLRAGDEVCISYIDHEESDREERQSGLNSYGFVCDCRRCQPAAKKRRRRLTRRPGAPALAAEAVGAQPGRIKRPRRTLGAGPAQAGLAKAVPV